MKRYLFPLPWKDGGVVFSRSYYRRILLLREFLRLDCDREVDVSYCLIFVLRFSGCKSYASTNWSLIFVHCKTPSFFLGGVIAVARKAKR